MSGSYTALPGRDDEHRPPTVEAGDDEAAELGENAGEESFELDTSKESPAMPASGFDRGWARVSPPPPRSRRRVWPLVAAGAAVLSLISASVWSGAPQAVQKTLSTAWGGAARMEPCGMCASSQATCSKYGIEALQLTRSYMGTGRRFRRLMDKAKRGEKITVGILGGSVSEGIDVPEKRRWHEIVASWFNETFPANEVELVNGAVPGRGTEYFMSCHGEHITKDADLVIIELGINDWHSGSPYDDDAETLVRSLLTYPNHPAIMFAESFSLTLPKLSSGSDAHIGVANYYDIPVISLRNWLLPELLVDPSKKTDYFFGDRDGTGQHMDFLHIGIDGHAALGEIINAMLDQQLCLSNYGHSTTPSSVSIAAPWPNQYDGEAIDRIPRLRLSDEWDDTLSIPPPNSKCMSLNSPHPESQLRFNEAQSSGWHKWDDAVPWRNVKTYLRGDKPGDRIVFSDIDINSGGWTLYYLRSNKKRLGNLRCWVDDEIDDAIYVEGWWERKMDVGEVLPMHTGLSIGKHDITCEIDERTNDPEGGHMFLLIALMYA